MIHGGRTCRPAWFDRRANVTQSAQAEFASFSQYKPRLWDSLSALSPLALLLFLIHDFEDREQEF
jgi:hypothetical protein